MNRKKLRANILLLLAALFWGSTFVAQRIAAGAIDPFPFQCLRCLLGALVLYACVPLFDRFLSRGAWSSRPLWLGGVLCGICLFASTNLQQFGISLGTTAGKSGFITALYIVLVPVFSIFLGRRSGLLVWISVVLAVAGLFFLCMTESLSQAVGDFVTLLCAVCFAVHILLVDKFSPGVDPIRLSCIQFLVCGLLSGAASLITGLPTGAQIAASWFPIVYAGVLSSAVAYTFQIIAQRNTDPAVASVLMSTESVFACLSGWIILGERLSGRELLGCALMFCAVLLSQRAPEKRA